MATKNDDRVYDELLCFLGDPIFQIPVRTFMDENSLIFDPSIQIGDDHREVHGQYKKLIDSLLEGFCLDAKITIDQAIAGISKMSEVPDLREVFQVLFEQVLAATDFNVFCQVMIKRNIMIQEQVLVMIIAATGQVPASFEGAASKNDESQKQVIKGAQDNQEEEVLRKIMQQSKEEQRKADSLKQKEEAELKQTIELSMKEANSLEESRKAMEHAMERMVLSAQAVPTTSQTAPTRNAREKRVSQPKPAAAAPVATKLEAAPVVSKAAPDMSSSQAANQWLQAAQSEAAGSSAAHSAMAASLSQLSPDELKKRQEFLSQQRDKLLAMKKETREKQLGAATKSQPQRPQSARAARSAMNNNEAAAAPSSSEDQRKIAMRKAIAEKLRQEVIDQ